jgi:hypothetical protein
MEAKSVSNPAGTTTTSSLTIATKGLQSLNELFVVGSKQGFFGKSTLLSGEHDIIKVNRSVSKASVV